MNSICIGYKFFWGVPVNCFCSAALLAAMLRNIKAAMIMPTHLQVVVTIKDEESEISPSLMVLRAGAPRRMVWS